MSNLFEGPIMCVTLDDGTKLYGPQTLPDNIYTRKYDQVRICSTNERSTDDILAFEHLKGVLETSDEKRPFSMRRWTLVDIIGWQTVPKRHLKMGSG
jgi:hypothetical protein